MKPTNRTPSHERAAPTLDRLREMALQHYEKSLFKVRGGSKENYFICWVDDMSDLIKSAGGDRYHFLNLLNGIEK
jgi:hypothetical protein